MHECWTHIRGTVGQFPRETRRSTGQESAGAQSQQGRAEVYSDMVERCKSASLAILWSMQIPDLQPSRAAPHGIAWHRMARGAARGGDGHRRAAAHLHRVAARGTWIRSRDAKRPTAHAIGLWGKVDTAGHRHHPSSQSVCIGKSSYGCLVRTLSMTPTLLWPRGRRAGWHGRQKALVGEVKKAEEAETSLARRKS